MMSVRMSIVAAALMLGSCTNPPPGSPPRPTGIPSTAIWTGGVDGGEFLVFGKKTSDRKLVYDAVIYHDFTGEVIFKGKLKLSAPGEIDPRFFREPKFFDGWDGTRLYLTDGRHLTAVSTSKE